MDEVFIDLVNKIETLTGRGAFTVSGVSISNKEKEIKVELPDWQKRQLAILLQLTEISSITSEEIYLLLSLPLHLLERISLADSPEGFPAYVSYLDGSLLKELIVQLYLNSSK